jgi:hypothetical protein
MEILRMEEMEISEIAVRLKDFSRLNQVFKAHRLPRPGKNMMGASPPSR